MLLSPYSSLPHPCHLLDAGPNSYQNCTVANGWQSTFAPGARTATNHLSGTWNLALYVRRRQGLAFTGFQGLQLSNGALAATSVPLHTFMDDADLSVKSIPAPSLSPFPAFTSGEPAFDITGPGCWLLLSSGGACAMVFSVCFFAVPISPLFPKQLKALIVARARTPSARRV
jgi:hypothetical protein